MRSDAYITVTCDKCQSEEEIQLVATARGGYDERNVDQALEELGWTVGILDICPECVKEDATVVYGAKEMKHAE